MTAVSSKLALVAFTVLLSRRADFAFSVGSSAIEKTIIHFYIVKTELDSRLWASIIEYVHLLEPLESVIASGSSDRHVLLGSLLY